MKKGALIATSVIAIVLSVVLIVGSTFALFSAESRIDISLTSGSVQLEAIIKDFELYSAESNAAGELVDENGARYSYKSVQNFTNGGTGFIENDGTVTFENMSAGDKAEFVIDLKNNSTMRVMFNTRLTLIGQDSNRLFDVMEISATPKGSDTSAEGETLDNYTYDSNAIRTDWTPLLTGENGSVKVSLGLPVDADTTALGASVQGVSLQIRCSVAAIQANKDVNGIALVTDEDGVEHDCITMAEVIKNAKNGSTVDIVRGDNGSYKDKYGIVNVDKDLTIASADGEYYKFNDLAFNVVDGGSLTLKYLEFYGDSYINATSATSVVVENCVIKSSPSVLFDEYDRQPLDRAAYVVATRVEQSGTLIKVKDTTFDMSDGSAAVYLDSALDNGSEITGNTFGKSGSESEDFAIVLNSIAANASINVSDNTFYGSKGVLLAQKYGTDETPVTVRLSKNKLVYGGENAAVLVKSDGLPIELTDNGSLVNGAAIGFENLDCAGKVLCGLSVTLGRDGLISGGTFSLSDALSAENNFLFFDRYVTHGYSPDDFHFVN